LHFTISSGIYLPLQVDSLNYKKNYNNFPVAIRRTDLLKTRTIWYNSTNAVKFVLSEKEVDHAMMNFEIFYMLQHVLKETMALDLHYVADPTGDITAIDQGLRTELFGPEGYQYLYDVLASEVRVGSVIHLQDQLHMNYFLFPAHTNKPPYCSVGPFLTAPLTDADWQATFDQYSFDDHQRKTVLTYLPHVPTISVQQAFSVVRNVLLAAHDSLDISVRVINMTAAIEPELFSVDISEYDEPRNSPEEIYRHECAVVQAVTDGDYEKALKTSNLLLTALAPEYVCDLREYLGLYHWANALYRKAAQDNGIPPYLVQELYYRMYLASDNCHTYAAYVSLQIHLLTAYCDLCREYSTKDYSPIIRQVVNYIRLNLSQDLDIQTIARNAGFSQTYITHKFKDEVGMPPSKFILEQRIRLAKKMLATSNKPISEIASDVGVPDWSYFSRLFKKSTGKSPSEFRKLYEKH